MKYTLDTLASICQQKSFSINPCYILQKVKNKARVTNKT